MRELTEKELQAVRADAKHQQEMDAIMERASFTPGPWQTSPDEYHDEELTVCGGETGEAVIATVWPIGEQSEIDNAEQAANRRLIVAAPELYEAALAIIKEDDLLKASGDCITSMGDLIDVLRSVVRKASDL